MRWSVCLLWSSFLRPGFGRRCLARAVRAQASLFLSRWQTHTQTSDEFLVNPLPQWLAYKWSSEKVRFGDQGQLSNVLWVFYTFLNVEPPFTSKCETYGRWMMGCVCKVQGDICGDSLRTVKSICMKRAHLCQEHIGRGLPFCVVPARMANGPGTAWVLKVSRSRKRERGKEYWYSITSVQTPAVSAAWAGGLSQLFVLKYMLFVSPTWYRMAWCKCFPQCAGHSQTPMAASVSLSDAACEGFKCLHTCSPWFSLFLFYHPHPPPPLRKQNHHDGLKAHLCWFVGIL